MTEFAAGASVMSLLLVGVLALAGYQEIDRRGIVSARQLAWQQSWWQGPVDTDATTRALHQTYLVDGGARDPQGRRLLVAEEDLTIHSENVTLSGAIGVAAIPVDQLTEEQLKVIASIPTKVEGK